MRVPGGKVYFQYELEVGEDTIMLDVEATISDYYPAVIYLRDGDPGYPAEGGEVEDLTVTRFDGTELKPSEITEELNEALMERALEEHGLT